MIDFIEKTMLAGFGALSLTQKKSEELLKDLKGRVDLTEEEGKQLLSRLQDAAKENQQRLEEIARQELKNTGARLGFVPQADFNTLAQRVTDLEERLKAKS